MAEATDNRLDDFDNRLAQFETVASINDDRQIAVERVEFNKRLDAHKRDTIAGIKEIWDGCEVKIKTCRADCNNDARSFGAIKGKELSEAWDKKLVEATDKIMDIWIKQREAIAARVESLERTTEQETQDIRKTTSNLSEQLERLEKTVQKLADDSANANDEAFARPDKHPE